MLFLISLDPRANIKGSRYPLGFHPIWTRFRRKVIRNLTTATTSVRDFMVLLMGFYFVVEQTVEQPQKSEADFPARLPLTNNPTTKEQAVRSPAGSFSAICQLVQINFFRC